MAIDCMFLLLRVKRCLSERYSVEKLSYGDVVCDVIYSPLRSCGQALLTLGSYGRGFANFFIVLTQFGFCCVYVVFISTHLTEVY